MYKLGDYVVFEGQPGLITMDLGDGLYRVRFHHGPARCDGSLREATIRRGYLVAATDEQKAAAIAAGATPENERSYLPREPRTRKYGRVR